MTYEWFTELAVRIIFSAYAIKELSAEKEAMEAVAAAYADDSASVAEEKCPAHSIRVLALIAAFMESHDLSLAEKECMVAVREEGDLTWILEALDDKAKLLDTSLNKGVFKTANSSVLNTSLTYYAMQMYIYNRSDAAFLS